MLPRHSRQKVQKYSRQEAFLDRKSCLEVYKWLSMLDEGYPVYGSLPEYFLCKVVATQ